MPKTKTQGIIFGIIMSYAMAIGMEIYNIAVLFYHSFSLFSILQKQNLFTALSIIIHPDGCRHVVSTLIIKISF